MKTAVAIFLVFFLMSAVSAHSPSNMELEYDMDNQRLKVVITHEVTDPLSHYVYKVDIMKNGSLYTTEAYQSQPSPSELIYFYIIDAKKGDTLDVFAECNQGGSITRSLKVEPSSVKKPGNPLLYPWQVHALVVGTGLIFMVVGALMGKYRKPQQWWFKGHKAISMTGGALGILGGLYIVSTVSVMGVHAYTGILDIVLIISTGILGYISVKKKPKVRNIHVWCGRLVIVLMAVTVVLGLIQTGII